MTEDPAGAASRERQLIEHARDEARAIADAQAALRRPAPDSFRGYRIVRVLEHGGQGVVYEAVQQHPHRTVAIKVLRAGPGAGAHGVARFEREVQVLAGLRHPNVVAIHDSGEAAGSFFYVMDYIPGRALDDHVAARGRPLRETIELLLKVCDAVNAGHLRGVIHRDLKPANIRVDPGGEPHVLDFGLAKITTVQEAGGPEPRRMSVSGQFIGSIPWASPEQAAGRPEAIDTRTDVYTLGVILFHSLVGSFPYPVDGTAREVLDRIIEREPARPRHLRHDIDGDLETIILTCLCKERDRRYQTAGELARDLRRYLAGDPIEARRASAWYLCRKFLQRHRVLAAVVGGLAVVLLALAVQWDSQRRLAADAAQLLASVGDMSALQAAADPFSPEVPTPFDLHQLERFARWLESEATGEPQVEARMRTTLGLCYLKLRAWERAEPHLARALSIRQEPGTPPRDLADSLHNLGLAHFHNGRYEEAAACAARSLDLREALFGDPSLELAESCNDLGACLLKLGRLEDAQRQHRAALRMRRARLTEDDQWVVASQNNLATCLKAQGRCQEALPLLEAAHGWVVEHGKNELFVVRSLRSIASCLAALGRYEEALPHIADAAARAARLPGDRAPETALCDLRLAECRRGLGDLVEAERLCRGALAIQQAGPRSLHPEVADTLVLLGGILADAGRPAEAKRWLTDALRLRESSLPADHYLVTEAREELRRLTGSPTPQAAPAGR